MISEKLKNRIIALVSDLKIEAYGDYPPSRIFTYLFERIGKTYELVGDNEEGFELVDILKGDKKELTTKGNHIISAIDVIINLQKEFDGFIFNLANYGRYVVTENMVVDISVTSSGNISEMLVVTDNDNIADIEEKIKKCLHFVKRSNDENSYKVAYRGQYAIEQTTCKFDKWQSNIKENYNDDLPYDHINSIIRKDKAGLIMFYGIPGTGKTSLVKSLINDNRETNFIFIDTSICESISDGMFLEFLQENKNSVIVFEDCEKLLRSRDEGMNDSIGTILNLTDGIIAESMKIKFICTFNCPLDDIDKALLRKGRLSLKYEFKELSLEKTKAIYPEAVKPMTLADAHNATEKNDYSEKKVRKIGF